jgi:hypothetical protein
LRRHAAITPSATPIVTAADSPSRPSSALIGLHRHPEIAVRQTRHRAAVLLPQRLVQPVAILHRALHRSRSALVGIERSARRSVQEQEARGRDDEHDRDAGDQPAGEEPDHRARHCGSIQIRHSGGWSTRLNA